MISYILQKRRLLLLLALAVLASVSLARVLLKDTGGRGLDFHAYWYSGHFLWQGMSPYPALTDQNVLTLEGSQLTLPIRYWDGGIVEAGDVGQAGFPRVPGLTAPAVLVISLLSRFSWPVAVPLWTGINCLLLLVIIWGCAKLLDRPVVSYESIVLLLVALSLIATRETLELGQSTIFVLAGMLAGLAIADRSQIGGGLLLGIALSKFTLIFPGLLIFLYKRHYRGAIATVAVQLLGTALLALFAHSSFVEIVAAYFRLLSAHAGMEGMHLGQGLLHNHEWLQIVFVLLAVVLVGMGLTHLVRRRQTATPVSPASVTFILLVIGLLVGLLSFYHRRYDFMAGIPFLALIILSGSQLGERFVLSRQQRAIVQATAALIAGVWILPLYLLTSPTGYVYIYQLTVLAALGLSFWLLYRLRWQSLQKVGQ